MAYHISEYALIANNHISQYPLYGLLFLSVLVLLHQAHGQKFEYLPPCDCMFEELGDDTTNCLTVVMMVLFGIVY